MCKWWIIIHHKFGLTSKLPTNIKCNLIGQELHFLYKIHAMVSDNIQLNRTVSIVPDHQCGFTFDLSASFFPLSKNDLPTTPVLVNLIFLSAHFAPIWPQDEALNKMYLKKRPQDGDIRTERQPQRRLHMSDRPAHRKDFKWLLRLQRSEITNYINPYLQKTVCD